MKLGIVLTRKSSRRLVQEGILAEDPKGYGDRR